MKVLVRYITKKRDGTQSFRNERITSEILHLGRGTYNEIDLPGTGVLLREGSIHKRDKQFYFEIEGKGGNVSIDGNFKRTSLLEIGSVISIGPYDISFVNSEDDVDLTLDVELVRSVTSSLEYLKKLGFVTWDKWIDESYDNEQDISTRILLIANACNSLPILPFNEL